MSRKPAQNAGNWRSPKMPGETSIQKKECFMRRPYPSIVAPGSKAFARAQKQR